MVEAGNSFRPLTTSLTPRPMLSPIGSTIDFTEPPKTARAQAFAAELGLDYDSFLAIFGQ
jgi:hypothetical protein